MSGGTCLWHVCKLFSTAGNAYCCPVLGPVLPHLRPRRRLLQGRWLSALEGLWLSECLWLVGTAQELPGCTVLAEVWELLSGSLCWRLLLLRRRSQVLSACASLEGAPWQGCPGAGERAGSGRGELAGSCHPLSPSHSAPGAESCSPAHILDSAWLASAGAGPQSAHPVPAERTWKERPSVARLLGHGAGVSTYILSCLIRQVTSVYPSVKCVLE